MSARFLRRLIEVYKMLYSRPVKDVVFMGSSGDDLRSSPLEARQRAGYQLYLAQSGVDPSDWKPMASLGAGAERFASAARDAYRVI